MLGDRAVVMGCPVYKFADRIRLERYPYYSERSQKAHLADPFARYRNRAGKRVDIE